MKAHVDKDLCISCQLCVSVCPKVFTMDNDDKAEPVGDELSPELEECAKEAAAQCPVEAITVK